MTHFINHIAPLINGYPIRKWQENTYIIENSATLSRKTIAKLFSSKFYCPIFSDSRILNNLVFTVVPFKKDESLNCEDKEITQEELWNSIESISSQFNTEEPLITQEKKICETICQIRQKVFLSCNHTASVMIDFFHETPSQGRLLDLGCGRGANSIFLLDKGWNVDAVDISKDALKLYKEQAQDHGITGRLRLIQGDITLKEFEKDCYDVVICYDTFSYIDSKKIRPLMEKIYNILKTNGKLFGSLFIYNENARTQIEHLEKFGAHFYKGQHIVPNLLNYTGLDITLCSLRVDGEIGNYDLPVAVEFIGTKK